MDEFYQRLDTLTHAKGWEDRQGCFRLLAQLIFEICHRPLIVLRQKTFVYLDERYSPLIRFQVERMHVGQVSATLFAYRGHLLYQ